MTAEEKSITNAPLQEREFGTANQEPVVGKSVPRVDIRRKVKGTAKYIDDLSRPNMLWGAILSSPIAHGRIISYDTSRAEAVEGVYAVVTGDDFPESYMGPFIKDECAIAKDKVRYIGEPIAAVAAVDKETAKRAARMIQVEYEELEPVLCVDDALSPDSPIVHEDLDSYVKTFDAQCYGNVASESFFEEGNVDAAWGECDVIVEGVYETQAQNHLSMEPCGALAEIDADGRVELWSANQSVFRVQSNIAECLDMPMTKIRCRTVDIGAGFGNKMELHIQGIVVVLALKAKRPVKITLTREEDFEMVRARHPMRIKMKTGAKSDGTLVAREVNNVLECGAFADDSPGVLGHSLLCARGPYRIPNMRTQGKLVYTNRLRFAAFRGFGNPQVAMAGESQLDELASKLGMDPIDFRLKNAIEAGDHAYLGQPIPECGFKQCLEQVRNSSAWDERRLTSGKEVKPGRRRGVGIAASSHISGLLSTGAIVRILEDGSVVLNTGAVDIGQGSDTVLCQICAETLKLPMERITKSTPDTDASPYNWGTTASRVTYMTGNSVKRACEKVIEKLKTHTAEMLSCDVEHVELRSGGWLGIIGDSESQVSISDISLRAHWAVGGPIIGSHSWVYDKDTVDPKRAIVKGLPFTRIGSYVYNAHVMEVEVDEETGQVTPLNSWMAVDVGRAINPQLVEGQMDGAVVQGLGYALCEEMVWEGARLSNPNMMDYRVPGTMDAPQSMETIIVEEPDPSGPYGAKSAGEIGINAVAPAVANAIYAASQVRLNKLPMKPERVLNAVSERVNNE